MKKIIMSALLLASLTTATYAKDGKNTQTPAATATDDNKKKIDPATLPDPVKATLAGDLYRGWTISNAWLVKADPAPYYSVELKKDDKTNTVNIDKDGNVK